MKNTAPPICRRFGAGILAAAILMTSVGAHMVAWAESTQPEFLNPKVTYSDDKTSAAITFDVNELDKDVYQITSITSDKEGTIVYNKATEKAVYETNQNGTYSFTVDYTEKQEVKNDTSDSAQPDKSVATDESTADNAEADAATTDDSSSKSTQSEDEVESSAEFDEVTDVTSPATLDLGVEDLPATLEVPVQDETENQPITLEEQYQPEYTYVNRTTNISVQVDGITEPKTNQSASQPTSDSEEAIQTVDDMATSTAQDQTVTEDRTGESSESDTSQGETPTSAIIDFTGTFNVSGVMAGKNNVSPTPGPITQDFYSISENTISIGHNDGIHYNQTIVAESQYKINFKRPFLISGKLSYLGGADGFTVSFTTKEDYTAKNTGSTLGVYKGEKGTNNREDGIPNGLVLEIDGINNYKEYGTSGTFGDQISQKAVPHLAIQTTDGQGFAQPGELVELDKTTDFGENITFEVSWDPATRTAKMVFVQKKFRIRCLRKLLMGSMQTTARI